MKTEVTTEITLTPDEVREIITLHFKNKNIKVKDIYFNVDAVYDESDWRGEYPPSYALNKVVCSSTEEKK